MADTQIEGTTQMQRIPGTSYELGYPIKDYVDKFSENWLIGIAERNPAILEMFADREKEPARNLLPWSGEFAGKYLTSGVQILRLTDDPGLRNYLKVFIDKLISFQAPNGYLGPWPKKYELTGKGPNGDPDHTWTWDTWNHYHIMLGLLLWYEDTQDKNVLAAAEKIGGLLWDRFSGNPGSLVGIGNPTMNLAPIHSLCLLYHATGKTDYLGLAEEIAENEFPLAGDYIETALSGKEFYQTPSPRWESLHAIMGIAELYRITGNKKYKDAFEHTWWSVVKLDRHNTGGFSSGEQAQGNPYNLGAIETCCTVAWSAMSVEMLRMTGNSIVADEMELTLWNATLGSLSKTGKWSTYNTPMNGRTVPNTIEIGWQGRPGSEELNCCSVNAPRGLGLISDWAVMACKDGLVLNWYGPSKFKTTVCNVPVVLEQKTDYPRNGKIQISVMPETPKEFPLKLRIPYWSENTNIRVNGKTVDNVKAGTYLTLERKWSQDSCVEIDLDMSLHFWVGQRECEGRTSIYKGPILLAYNPLFPPSFPSFNGNWGGDSSLRFSKDAGDTLRYTFEGDGIRWVGKKFDDAGKAIVTIDGKEVALVDQYGPYREESFSWEYRGLGDGTHEITIEVSAQKNENSKGTFINMVELIPTDAEIIPHLDAATLSILKYFTSEDSLVTLEVKDINNKTVVLKDFDSSGEQGQFYITWLIVDHIEKAEFTQQNPLRSCRYK